MTSFTDPIFRSPAIEKKLLAPSLRTGHTWIDAAVRNGARVVNLRVTTLAGWALELAGPSLIEQGLTLAPERVSALAVEAAWKRLPAGGYLSQLKPTPAVYAAVAGSLEAIRLAGVDAEGLAADSFEVPAKAIDLEILLKASQELLASHRLIDRSGVLKLAIERLRKNSLPEHLLLLVPDTFQPTGLERALVEAVPERHRRTMILRAATDGGADLRLLRCLPEPAAAPAPTGDNSVTFFRAVGEANELREVLRRCVSEVRRLDEVEVLCTDTETYLPLFHSLALTITDQEFPRGLPVTFADGLPATLSRPGRALTNWLRWILEDFPQPLLVQLLMDGLLKTEISNGGKQQKSLDPIYLATLLRPIAVGLGGERYLPRLDEQISTLRDKIAADADLDLADEEAVLAAKRRKGRLEALDVLRSVVADLLERSAPVVSGSPTAVLEAAEGFVRDSAAATNELDRNGRLALIEEIRQMRKWVDRFGVAGDVRQWLATLPTEVPLLGSGPRPGHLHVSSITSGGHSGRSRIFVVGLDDGRFPGAGLPDPILLDGEREQLHPELSTARARTAAKVEDFARQLARVPGNVTLSWSCRHLADDSELHPCPVLLTALRIVSGRADADLAALDAAAGAPASFAPVLPEQALSEMELWLWRFAGSRESARKRLTCVGQRYPDIGHGLAARQRCVSGDFCEFNGHVPDAGKLLDPFSSESRPLSASAIEQAGRCPRAFFFERALELEPLDEEKLDPNCWLDPLSFGGLLHDVFRTSLSGIVAAGERPSVAKHSVRLKQILEAAIHKRRDESPPPNEHAYQADCRRLTEVAEAFLRAEEQAATKSQPLYFEVALGLKPDGTGTPLDDPDPVLIVLPSGRTIRLRGRIDRIDRDPAEPEGYCIWDYKTGRSTTRYEKKNFNGGRILQNALYVPLAEAALQRRLSPKARVTRFGYLFPAIDGRLLEWSAEALAEGQKLVDAVCRLIADGGFLATNDSGDCGWCDYQSACGNVEEVACQSQALLGNVESGPLAAFVELRSLKK